MDLFAGFNAHRALGPWQAGILQACILTVLFKAGEALLRATVGFNVHCRIEPGKAVADPLLGDGIRQAAEQYHIECIGTDAANDRQCSQWHFIQLTPGLIGGVAVIATCHVKRCGLKGFLLMHAYSALWQLQYTWFTDINLQAVIEQFALDALLMLATLRQLVGATAE